MGKTERSREPVREFQLEGFGLVLVGAAVVACLLGSFMLGRWYERQQHPASARAGSSGDPLAHVELPDKVVDVADTASYFDLAEGGQKQAEPDREARRDPPPVDPPPALAPSVPGSSAASAGDYFVQVFAGRDEQAASSLLAKLETAGHPVRLHTDRQGSTTLYKVRVGGFETQDLARDAAARLLAEGYSGAWVTHVQPSP